MEPWLAQHYRLNPPPFEDDCLSTPWSNESISLQAQRITPAMRSLWGFRSSQRRGLPGEEGLHLGSISPILGHHDQTAAYRIGSTCSQTNRSFISNPAGGTLIEVALFPSRATFLLERSLKATYSTDLVLRFVPCYTG